MIALTWLFVILLSYLFFGVSVFGDKVLLLGPPNSKSYTFYVAVLGIVVLVFVPFAHMAFPGWAGCFWIFLAALTYLLGIYFMFSAIEDFEVSQVMPAVGALQPIFILVSTQLFFGFQSISFMNIVAFALLVLGSFVISLEHSVTINKKYIKLILASALLFALAYVFSKMVFLQQSFLPGLVYINASVTVLALTLLFDQSFRQQIFHQHAQLDKKHAVLFFAFQSTGAVAGFLQNLAIALVPVGYLAIMNSLRGVQYIFLFAITLFFSLVFPKVFKENISYTVIIQKSLAIVIIVAGLALLVAY
jgi:drug/metabolite transporter (DMT)-like permease